jgi:hypothetical protein
MSKNKLPINRLGEPYDPAKRFELRYVKSVAAAKATASRAERRYNTDHGTDSKAVRVVIGFFPTYEQAVTARDVDDRATKFYELIDHKRCDRIKFSRVNDLYVRIQEDNSSR